MSDSLKFAYTFQYAEGTQSRIELEVDPKTMNLIPEPQPSFPKWTELGFNQCPGCKLDPRLDPHCPVAVNLLIPVSVFKDSVSYDDADIIVEGPERTFFKHTSLQEAVSALVGLCMATSSCPAFQKLKPMVRFHLPFATPDETMYRVLSTYLLAQYIKTKRGGKPDWDLKELDEMYDKIRVVNKHMVQRLREVAVKDASLNALVNLDCFAISVKFSINLENIEDIANLFVAYTD